MTLFKIDEQASLGPVTLKVQELKRMADYYTLIGLKKITETSEQISLGTSLSQPPLLILKKIKTPNQPRKVAGLYHTAFLVPARKDLGNVLYHLLSAHIPISGASDHGYSEALYLQDPEGNGIEIYRDKPKAEWVVESDGRIPGITVEMDAEGVLASSDQTPAAEFAEGTRIGHVHLSVADLDQTQDFYERVLGFDLKDQYGDHAKFYAANGYHHHIGTNIWQGRHLPAPEPGDIGLEKFSVRLSSKERLDALKTHILDQDHEIVEADEKIVTITDPSGIKIDFTIEF